MIEPVLEAWAKIFSFFFGSNENLKICFWDILTFIAKVPHPLRNFENQMLNRVYHISMPHTAMYVCALWLPSLSTTSFPYVQWQIKFRVQPICELHQEMLGLLLAALFQTWLNTVLLFQSSLFLCEPQWSLIVSYLNLFSVWGKFAIYQKIRRTKVWFGFFMVFLPLS